MNFSFLKMNNFYNISEISGNQCVPLLNAKKDGVWVDHLLPEVVDYVERGWVAQLPSVDPLQRLEPLHLDAPDVEKMLVLL